MSAESGANTAAFVQAKDWSRTPLGPIERWPRCLRMVVDMVLAHPRPMIVRWGPDLIQIYNDGYARIAGHRHPAALGQPTRECWPEVWPAVASTYERILTHGESVLVEDQLLPITRDGVVQDAYFTLGYSPLRNDDGTINGVLQTVTETTANVVGKRELAHAEAACRESELRYRTLVNAGSHVVYRMSLDWSEMRRLDGHGFLSDTASPSTVWLDQYIYPDDQACVRATIRHAIRTKSVFELEHRVRRADGTVGWTSSRAVPILDDHGDIIEWIGTANDVTAHHRAEDALRASEERLQRTVNIDGVGVLTFDAATGTLINANDAFLKMTGYTREQVAERQLSWLTMTPPEYVEESRRQMERFAKTGRVGPYEKEYFRQDGSRSWMVFAGASLGDGTVVEYCIDVSDRKRAEAALRASEDRLRRIVNVEGVGVLTFDVATGTLTDANDAFLKLTGYAREDITAKRLTWRTMTPPEYVEATERQMRQLAETGRIGPYEKEYLRKDGSRSWMMFAGASLRDGTAVKYCMDISGRKRAEAALRESEQQFRHLADAMPQIVWITRPDGYHEYFNRRSYEFSGLPEGSVDGDAWINMLHPDDRERTLATWRDSLATGEPYEIEYRFRHRSGEYHWTLGRAVPIHDESGAITKWFGTTTDIDALKRLQHERDSLLASEQTTRVQAEAANRAKDRFLAVLSHELRTPLTPVALAAAAMEADPTFPDAFRDDIAMICRNAELETHLIDDLLDVSRVITGKLRINRQPTHLHQVIRHVLETVGEELHDKHMHVETDNAARHDLVDGDPARLQQVLWNLLKNAGKFTPAGGRITIRTRNDEAGHVMIEVRDTGKGIPADVLPHVFDAFEYGADEVTRKHGGLGLGLAIVKAIIDRHGGTIRADSDGDGKGAMFTVTLPLLARAEAATPAPVAEKPDAAAGRQKHARLLLVEDHVDTAKLLGRLLRSRGFDVQLAHSVAEALASASSQPFDVVISDLGLPDGSGHDVMRELHRQPTHPVGIAMSGYGMDEDIRASRDAGFAEHLTKPVDLPSLEAAVRRASATADEQP